MNNTLKKTIGITIGTGMLFAGASIPILPSEYQLTYTEYFEYLAVKDTLIKEIGGIEIQGGQGITPEMIDQQIEQKITEVQAHELKDKNKTFVIIGEEEYTWDELKEKNSELKEKIENTRESLIKQIL